MGQLGKCRVAMRLMESCRPRIPDGFYGTNPRMGEDIPLIKGAKSISHCDGTPRGIVLHLHGCNGMGWNKYAEIWGAYFNALGYDFFAPDSFSEPRPAEVCGYASESKGQGPNHHFETAYRANAEKHRGAEKKISRAFQFTSGGIRKVR